MMCDFEDFKKTKSVKSVAKKILKSKSKSLYKNWFEIKIKIVILI